MMKIFVHFRISQLGYIARPLLLCIVLLQYHLCHENAFYADAVELIAAVSWCTPVSDTHVSVLQTGGMTMFCDCEHGLLLHQ